MSKPRAVRILEALSSLKLTIATLLVLMVLVVACTLAQVSMGLLGAVNAYVRSWFVWWQVPGTAFSVAVFPGGVLAGAVLLVNLSVATLRRLEWSWRKSGLWLTHAGLILLVVGEFVSALAQVESRLSIEQGQTLNFVERPREYELALVDTTDAGSEGIYAIPESRLHAGGLISLPGTDLAVEVRRFMLNSEVRRRAEGEPGQGVDRGVGTGVTVDPLPPVTRDDAENQPSAIVAVSAGQAQYGTWLVSTLMGAPQSFQHAGRTYQVVLRNRREYLPYSVTLKKFSHDVYPGTNIPKNFSSLVHLSNPQGPEERDVLIFMNQPLRYEGKAFYQASFGRGDTLSILQVVDNPGWLIPYVSCALVSLGLLVHFALSLRRGFKKVQAAQVVPVTSVDSGMGAAVPERAHAQAEG
jgi:hypothetical protein